MLYLVDLFLVSAYVYCIVNMILRHGAELVSMIILGYDFMLLSLSCLHDCFIYFSFYETGPYCKTVWN